MRTRRALAALGPLGGAAGAVLGYASGVALVLGVDFVLDDLDGLGSLAGLGIAYGAGAFLTWLAYGFGLQRQRPYHAVKAAAVLALIAGLPCACAGMVLAAAAGC
jgi:hypothetical protein